MGATKTAARMPPPPRGRPYYDAKKGQRMILPHGGGKAIPYVGTEPAKPSPARRARVVVREEARATGAVAKRATRTTSRTLTRAGAMPPLGTSTTGWGGLLIYGFASIVALALLDALLRGRGPAGVDVAFRGLSQGIRKLIDPTDPIIGPGPAPTKSTAPAAPSAGATSATADANSRATGLEPIFASSLDRLIAASGGRVWIDSGFRSVAEQTKLWNAKLAELRAQGLSGSALIQEARRWVAPPGASNHNRGIAADLAGNLDWAQANARRFGLHFPMSWEDWHVEPIGSRD